MDIRIHNNKFAVPYPGVKKDTNPGLVQQIVYVCVYLGTE
jgi:hypothetical protein